MRLLLPVLFIPVALVLLFGGCKKLNPDEEIPSYIQITGYTFTADTINQGTRMQGFSDCWVYRTDGELLGCYPVGARIPVLAEGPTTLLIRGGIKNCGAGDLRSFYPVTQFYTANVDLVRGEVKTVSPDFSYYPGSTFLRVEGFYNSGTFLAQSNSSDTMLVMYQGTESLAGQGNCAHVYLDDTYQVFDAKSGSPHPYTVGAPCFFEMQFKSDVGIYVSVSDGINDIRSACYFKETDEWKKVYVNLTEYLNSPVLLSNFYLVLHASKPADGTVAHIYFDNIKLIKQ